MARAPTVVKLPQIVIVKSAWLLPMMYNKAELAEEIGASEHDVYLWMTHGAPHQYDNQNHIWIIGTEFAEWVEEQQAKRKKRQTMGPNEAFCFRCDMPVTLENPEIIPIQGKLIHLRGTCPNCKCRVFRGGRSTDSNIQDEGNAASLPCQS